jgi:hypothetical protein
MPFSVGHNGRVAAPPVAMPIISVHIPKTAGTAFGMLLSRKFGSRLLKDYADQPLSHGWLPRLAGSAVQLPLAPSRLRGFDAVHGHFLPLKYLAARGDVVTWLREPAQRILSRYEHYRRDVAEGRALQRVPGLRPGLGLAEFIEIPRFQDTYAKYFQGFPLRRVACFGFSEDMEEGLARMRRSLGLDLGPALTLNANPDMPGRHYDIPAALARRIARLNRRDYRLWHRAREQEGV